MEEDRKRQRIESFCELAGEYFVSHTQLVKNIDEVREIVSDETKKKLERLEQLSIESSMELLLKYSGGK